MTDRDVTEKHRQLEVDVHAALLAAEETAEAAQVAPEVFGLAAFGALVFLLAVTYAFRSVGTRH